MRIFAEVELLLDGWTVTTGSTSSRSISSSSGYSSNSEAASGDSSLESIYESTASKIVKRTQKCRTVDGWNLHIVHVVDQHARQNPAKRKQHPVLLCPGLASSGAIFDLDPSVSVAEYLAAKGFDVWIADLRGNGLSDKPIYSDSTTWWSVDDHLEFDVPAIVDYVLLKTGAQQLHWVGHSMGGMLACGALSSQAPSAAAFKSVTMLASGCFGTGSWHSWCQGLINMLCTAWGFPAGYACWLLSLLSGSICSLSLFETFFYWRSNMAVPIQKKLLSECFTYIPPGVIKQFMGSLNTETGISSSDGARRFADPSALAEVQTPILAINGDWDLFCPAAGGLKTVQMYGSQSKRFVFMGPQYGTGKSHYGHFDLLVGKRVQEEVYPKLGAWLDEQDAAGSDAESSQ